MAKSKKSTIDYYKIGIHFARLLMALFIMYLGWITLSEMGERQYNKYLHSLRKMYLPTTKPNDVVLAGMTWDALNKTITMAIGAMILLSGLLIGYGRQKQLGGLLGIVGCLFMMASKDNFKIKSTVAVIVREKDMRLENFCRDASLIGAFLILLGGLGGKFLTDISIESEEEKAKAD